MKNPYEPISASDDSLPLKDEAPNYNLPPSLGFPTLVLLVVASMIGIGCFVSSGYALLALGNPSRVVLAWALCGIWALSGAIAYGGLARRVPLSGGEYLYLTRLMHPSIGFLAGWISLVAGFTAPIAAMSETVVKYALPPSDSYVINSLTASAIILVACVMHSIKVQLGATAQNLIVLLKLLFIAVFLFWAWQFRSHEALWLGRPLANRELSMWPVSFAGMVTLFASMSWISLSYTGFNAAVYVAGESKSAQRNVPRAMMWAAVLVWVIYVALNYVFVYAASPEEVAKDPEGIAILAARQIGGSSIVWMLRSIVSLAVLSSVFSMLLAGPRVYVQMARDGVMPKLLLHTSGVPRLAIWMQAILSIAIVWIASLEKLIGYLGMTLSACSALAVSAIFFMPKGSRPLTVLEGSATVAYVIGTLLMLTSVLVEGQRRVELWAMLITFAIGVLIYIGWQVVSNPDDRDKSKAANGSSTVENHEDTDS